MSTWLLEDPAACRMSIMSGKPSQALNRMEGLPTYLAHASLTLEPTCLGFWCVPKK